MKSTLVIASASLICHAAAFQVVPPTGAQTRLHASNEAVRAAIGGESNLALQMIKARPAARAKNDKSCGCLLAVPCPVCSGKFKVKAKSHVEEGAQPTDKLLRSISFM